jgi:hypothetical protein
LQLGCWPGSSWFLEWLQRGTKVCKRVTIQGNRHVIVHGGHFVTMLRGRDSSLIDKCNCVGPIFLEGVDHLDNLWDRVLTQDPVFVLLGVHSTMLDDVQANVDYVTVIHRVACSNRLGSANEEARYKGLKTFGGMPCGSHSLPIFLAIFDCGTPVL